MHASFHKMVDDALVQESGVLAIHIYIPVIHDPWKSKLERERERERETPFPEKRKQPLKPAKEQNLFGWRMSYTRIFYIENGTATQDGAWKIDVTFV